MSVALTVFALRTLASFGLATITHRNRDDARAANARLLRETLEGLGATFIKFGQVLAMRPDYLSPPYIKELQRLLDDVPAFAPPVAVRVIEDELGSPIDGLFLDFDGKLLGSASFAQVYEARLHSGERVAVKVQRPKIEALVRVDLRLMRGMCTMVDATAILMRIKLRPLFADLEAWTWQELDYRIEGRFANRIRLSARRSTFERIPEVHWGMTTKRVLVLELFEGIWITEILSAVASGDEDALTKWANDGVDLDLVARRLLRTMLRQGLQSGLFHADPHASNIVVLEDNVVGLVDFGIMGYVGRDLREKAMRLFAELGNGNASSAFRELIRIIEPPGHADLKSFKREFSADIEAWHNAASDPLASLEEKSTARLLFGNLNSMRRHGLHLPTGLIRYYRALIILDTILLRLDPDIDVAQELASSLTEISTQEMLKDLTWDRYYSAGLGYQAMSIQLPQVLSELLDVRLLSDVLDNGRNLAQGFLEVGREFTRAKEVVLRLTGSLLLFAALVIVALGARGTGTYRVSSITVSWPVAAALCLLAGVCCRWLARRVRAGA